MNVGYTTERHTTSSNFHLFTLLGHIKKGGKKKKKLIMDTYHEYPYSNDTTIITSMESLVKSDKFLELMKKLSVPKAASSSSGKVVKRPKFKVRDSSRGTSSSERRGFPILKPTPVKSSGGNPNFISIPFKQRSAFVPVLSPMKPKDYVESVSKLRSGSSQLRYLPPNDKLDQYEEIPTPERTLKAHLSSSIDSGFERSNPQNSTDVTCSSNASKLLAPRARIGPHRPPKISKNLFGNVKASSPVSFVRPKTPPPKSKISECFMKAQLEFVETVRYFTDQNAMFTTSEILFHLNNLKLCLIKKMSKSAQLNRSCSRYNNNKESL
ncbi:hypothetical protein GE061_004924 [Apolygus lucorum]|uniref:Uncharacterized protein n=1 Tax=Apolygus lucorum TaxID=248454 RepID=A0A6A4IRN6_APOLU|nr:hypothetical protein GE061_004924 [Apolygus lucorum]